MSDFANLKLTCENGIAVLTMSRPKALNALNSETLAELEKAINYVANSDHIHVLVVTGEGRAFVAGADIGEMQDMNPQQAREFSRFGQSVFDMIEKLEKPTIAAINGYALGGGCELALCCDLRIAGVEAKFGQPEVGLGIIPGFGGTQRLPRLVGIAKAKELIFTGNVISAEEAHRIGLVNAVVPCEEVLNAALELAVKIVKKAQVAIKYAKVAIDRGLDCNGTVGNVIESDSFALCFSTYDQKEGMDAFLSKRKPAFKHE